MSSHRSSASTRRRPTPHGTGLSPRSTTNRVTVAIISKYGIEDVYISIKEALKHAGRALSTEVKIAWLDAERYERCQLKDYDGILIPGGFGKRGIEGKIEAIKFARENNVPFLGLCLGFQLGNHRVCTEQVRYC